jgi:hydroxyacylglutathione hydrolase
MLLERLYDDDLAQASYLIGCEASGEMLVVDPLRDPAGYLDAARRHGMRIVAVTETHIHADYLSGSRELARVARARLYLSAEGTDEWHYAFAGEPLSHGSEIRLGNVTVTAVHTPGHTPEHLSFLVTDGAAANEPGYLLTGDFVFVGDVGRPDLLDEAAGGEDTRAHTRAHTRAQAQGTRAQGTRAQGTRAQGTSTRFAGARQMYASLRDRFLALPDYLQVLPGHGAGSACGKSLGAVPSTTVGYERRFSWWAPFLEKRDEEGFVAALLEGQPDAPSYFARMKRLNREGPPPLETPSLETAAPLERLEPGALAERLRRGGRLIDTRPAQRYIADPVAGSLHVPAGPQFTTYASYALDPERDPELRRGPVYLLAADETAARELSRKLALLGIDDVGGFVTRLDGLERRRLATVTSERLASLPDAFVLDVRSRSEYEAAHIPGASQLHVGRLQANLTELPRERPLVVHCQGGGRSAVAASMLLAAGFENVVELEGSFSAWQRAASEPKRTLTK